MKRRKAWFCSGLVMAVVLGITSPVSAAGGRFWELQLNLCNSGIAGCYSQGRAVGEGADLIRSVRPDLVTSNEICAGDVASLVSAMNSAWPGDQVYSAFNAAVRRDTGGAVTCVNGQEYGNAVVGRVPAGRYQGVRVWRGKYASQDGGNEQRTYVCAHAIGDHVGCATHLSASGEVVALAQCRALMFEVVPAVLAAEGVSGRTVVGGDFNLEYDTSDPENVQKCVPPGHVRKGDGDVQHVVFSSDVGFVGSSRYGMRYTDHDGWLVRLSMP